MATITGHPDRDSARPDERVVVKITLELGSPPNALRLASAEGHSNMMLRVNDQFGVVPPDPGGDQNERVRADMAFFETPAGRAVFATASIAAMGRIDVLFGRLEEAEDVAKAVVFLCCDASAFMTGQGGLVDGGVYTG